MSVKITREFVENSSEGDILTAISRNIFPNKPKTSIINSNGNGKTMMAPSSSAIKADKNAKPTNGHILPEQMTGIHSILDVKCFNGRQKVYQHYSRETNCVMKFSVYLPEESELADEKFHVVIFLSGIMCNEQNFLFKTGFQQYASEQKLIVVGADTSPRGMEFPGDRDTPIFGRSAGWYIDATEEPWKTNYRMYSYISKELPEIIRSNFPTTDKIGLVGHSMGGNGAVVLGLRNPSLFSCISLLSPSCNPTAWGQDLIFQKFLGGNEDKWKEYDACHVAKTYDGPQRNILLDVGGNDEYLDFLVPDRLKKCAEINPNKCIEVDLTIQDGYDHSYNFVGTFIEKHLKYQKTVLDQTKSEES